MRLSPLFESSEPSPTLRFIRPGLYLDGIFLVVYRHGGPVGCGGCRRLDDPDETVEIKKTYLASEARGSGLGRYLLRLLEEYALFLGGRRTVLETGIRNTAAPGLFLSSGYTPTNSYVRGRDPSINRAFVKCLVDSSSHPTAGKARQPNA